MSPCFLETPKRGTRLHREAAKEQPRCCHRCVFCRLFFLPLRNASTLSSSTSLLSAKASSFTSPVPSLFCALMYDVRCSMQADLKSRSASESLPLTSVDTWTQLRKETMKRAQKRKRRINQSPMVLGLESWPYGIPSERWPASLRGSERTQTRGPSEW